jgi:hypothetical protein
MKKVCIFILAFTVLVYNAVAQQVSLTGQIINPYEDPIKNVLVCLTNNPTISCRSDSLGNFTLFHQISTSITDVRQDGMVSFENRNLSLYANNQSISVDIININGGTVKNILNLSKSVGTVSLYPEAYITDLPKAIYIVRVRVGNTFQSFKIQNLVPSNLSQGITHYSINNIVERPFAELKSEPLLETLDTLVLVHDFYKSRKIPLDSYSIQYDTLHLNNFADYTIAEGFEPALTYLESGYGAFTNIHSEGDIQFIIDYDTLAVLEDNLKLKTIPVGKIESLDNSIKFISGLHLEPSGTEFLQPVQVTVLLKDSIPKHLVVFQCDDQGLTNYVPYVTHPLSSSPYYSVVFIINHFSSVGIGTGQINRDSDYSKFTTSEQFETYGASYSPDYNELPPDFWSYWFNNVVAPKITAIQTWEDFCNAYREFSLIVEEWHRMGFEFEVPPFYSEAYTMFCEKVSRIWNNCKAEYEKLEDNCLKREISKIALNLAALSQAIAGEGSFCPGFSAGDLNDLGNGEAMNLAFKIELATQVKHLKIGDSYNIGYTLKSPSGTPPVPEVVSWSSSKPSVAEVDTNGIVYAKNEGVAFITGRICDITNDLKIEVGGGVNCETQYCLNRYDSCYSGRYLCTGVLSGTRENDYNPNCPHVSYISRYTIEGSLNHFPWGYYHKVTSSTYEQWDNDLKICITRHGLGTIDDGGSFTCRDYSFDYTLKNFFVFHSDSYSNESFMGYYNNITKELSIDIKELGSVKTTKMHCIRIGDK